MNAHATRLRARGFSLIEVMVAVIVICIGVLGIAKMQALALSNTNTSRLRSLAAIEAASLAASMHSNRNFWGAATANYTVTPTAITSAGDAGTAAIATGQLAAPVLCDGRPLSAAEPGGGAYDLAKWVQSLGAVLPNPTATITYTNLPGVPGPPSFTVAITWNENAVSMTKPGDRRPRPAHLHAVRRAMKNLATKRLRSAPRARGFTLVELMVTVAIALFLIGGLLTIIQNVRNRYTDQQALAQLQDQQRFAMGIITDIVQQAGYFPDPPLRTPRPAGLRPLPAGLGFSAPT